MPNQVIKDKEVNVLNNKEKRSSKSDLSIQNEDFFDTMSHFSFRSSVRRKKSYSSNSSQKTLTNHRRISDLVYNIDTAVNSPNMLNYNDINSLKGIKRKTIKRRTKIPPRPNEVLNFEVIKKLLKNCIGKDLSRIPVPCNFSEPISFLQRITEILEYSSLLDKAAECTDPLEQMAYVAAFSVSNYSTCTCRQNKPFNPMLGETFECDRLDDYGWRSIAEQVSHHPPGIALVT